MTGGVLFALIAGCSTNGVSEVESTRDRRGAIKPSHCSFQSEDGEFKLTFVQTDVFHTQALVPRKRHFDDDKWPWWKLKVQFTVADCEGWQSFRLARTGEVLECRTSDGSDLARLSKINYYNGADKPFSVTVPLRSKKRSQDNTDPLDASGEIECQMPRVPDQIERLRGYIEVEVVRDLEVQSVPREKLSEWYPLRSGLRVRMSPDEEMRRLYGGCMEYERTDDGARILVVDAIAADRRVLGSFWQQERLRLKNTEHGGYLMSMLNYKREVDSISEFRFHLSNKIERVRIDYDLRDLRLNQLLEDQIAPKDSKIDGR